MSIDKCQDELDRLVEIARGQGDKINLSIILFSLKIESEDLPGVLEFFSQKDVDVVDDDVELDPTDAFVECDVKPFDPSKIDIKMDKITIDSIIKRIKNDELELDSSFQRKKGLWTIKQKSRLIESIFLKIPLPAFYFDASNDDRWQIIDGLQRVWTIKQYVVDQDFMLSGLEFLKDFDGLKFNQLPRAMQRRIEETNLNAYLVNPSTPINVKFNIFKRINTGGLILESQEIRNALFQGQATEFLIEMSNIKEFKLATDNSIKTERMLDREFCLRYVAITRLPLDELINGVEEFLNNGMKYLQSASKEELGDIRSEFAITMGRCRDIFGKQAFRKVNIEGKRAPINKYLFEAWSLIIKNLDCATFELLVKRREALLEGLSMLCSNNDFQSYLRSSDRNSAKNRIRKLTVLVEEVAGKRL